MGIAVPRAGRTAGQGEHLLSDDRSEFAKRIHALRTKRGRSLRQAGTETGIDFTYLSKLENDNVPAPSLELVHRFARGLRATGEELASLISALEKRREESLSLRPDITKTEDLLLRRIYSGGLTRGQLRQIADVIRSDGVERRVSAKR